MEEITQMLLSLSLSKLINYDPKLTKLFEKAPC